MRSRMYRALFMCHSLCNTCISGQCVTRYIRRGALRSHMRRRNLMLIRFVLLCLAFVGRRIFRPPKTFDTGSRDPFDSIDANKVVSLELVNGSPVDELLAAKRALHFLTGSDPVLRSHNSNRTFLRLSWKKVQIS